MQPTTQIIPHFYIGWIAATTLHYKAMRLIKQIINLNPRSQPNLLLYCSSERRNSLVFVILRLPCFGSSLAMTSIFSLHNFDLFLNEAVEVVSSAGVVADNQDAWWLHGIFL